MRVCRPAGTSRTASSESIIPNILRILKPPDDQRLLLEKVRSIGPQCDPNQSGVNAGQQPTPSIAAIQNREEEDPVPALSPRLIPPGSLSLHGGRNRAGTDSWRLPASRKLRLDRAPGDD